MDNVIIGIQAIKAENGTGPSICVPGLKIVNEPIIGIENRYWPLIFSFLSNKKKQYFFNNASEQVGRRKGYLRTQFHDENN